ncbi:MAG: histidinol-phosphatase (PHP family) [bacterium]|jgi:histidinol-phosphatase (PHP family)
MKKNNYHTHTFRCKHATGDVVDYAREAFNGGATILGISDHVPWPDHRWDEVRMDISQLDEYEQAIEHARKIYPKLKILKGMECEYNKEFHSYLEDELLGKRQYQYLVGAGHYTYLDGEWWNSFLYLKSARALQSYAKNLIEIMDSGLYAFLAHPDLFGCGYDEWNPDIEKCAHDILQAAEDTKTPLEINGNGFRKDIKTTKSGTRYPYPWKTFWEMAGDYDIQVICNSDAHEPENVLANLEDCYQIADDCNLTTIELINLLSL